MVRLSTKWKNVYSEFDDYGNWTKAHQDLIYYFDRQDTLKYVIERDIIYYDH